MRKVVFLLFILAVASPAMAKKESLPAAQEKAAAPSQKQMSLQELKEIVKKNPQSAEAYYNLGFVYHKSGQSKEAIPYLKKAIALDPKKPSVYTTLALAYYSLGKNQEAVPQAQKALGIDPQYVPALTTVVILYSAVN